MPDDLVHGIYADKLLAEIDRDFHKLDANGDGNLTRKELHTPVANEFDVDRHMREAAVRFADDYFKSIAHSEPLALQLGKDGLPKSKTLFDDQLKVLAPSIDIISKQDIANLRKSLSEKHNFEMDNEKPCVKDVLNTALKSFSFMDRNDNGQVTAEEIKEKLKMVEPGSSAWFYYESASLNYVKDRIGSDKSLPTNRIEEQVEVTPKKVIPGYSSMSFIQVGKALIPMNRSTPSRTIPATYRTDVHNQPYITKPIMDQWIKR